MKWYNQDVLAKGMYCFIYLEGSNRIEIGQCVDYDSVTSEFTIVGESSTVIYNNNVTKFRAIECPSFPTKWDYQPKDGDFVYVRLGNTVYDNIYKVNGNFIESLGYISDADGPNRSYRFAKANVDNPPKVHE